MLEILLTVRAAERVQALIAKQGGVALRVGLRKVGCAGMAYTFDIAQEITSTERVFEQHGAKLAVDAAALPCLAGATLDYAREGLKETFKFSNPNEKSACGCGESVNF
ncbi:MAG: iron-sulfur cluster assembly protein IscA [Candidatus Muproteobacteria bacterium RBG_16_64_11]|uniref:Iron-sulfur cluster assembly protein IscA n=1 Tax=Candidatus Muproteobacteria bacterium RBG_16_64_11 TaxID=1817758 RepID=A0A1F6TAU4_9PROT|nr:MAG: iron-sulfur cluster assembly protein IscA [Candidatus Muproteobacteria bacterium RBG_16_64_11]